MKKSLKKFLLVAYIALIFFAPTTVAHAARLWNGGAELNSTTDEMEVTLNTAPISITTSNVKSDTYNWRITGGNGFLRQHIASANQTGTGISCADVYIVASPTATSQFFRWSNTANASVGNISIKTTRVLALLKSDGSQIGSDSAALALNTHYQVCLKITAPGNPGTLEGTIDGVSFASGNNSNQGSFARALIGTITGSQTTTDIYFDDWKINDASGSAETGYPTTGKLVMISPDAAGDANSFAVQVGGTAGSGNNFTRTNEIPPDDATSYNASAVVTQEDLFNMGASGTASVDTIKVVTVGIRMADLVGTDATTAFKVEAIKTASGTKAQSSAIIPNSTAWITNAAAVPRNYPLVLYNDPDGSAWTGGTGGTLDSMQAGYALTAFSVQSIAISNVWVYIDYTVGVAGTRERKHLIE